MTTSSVNAPPYKHYLLGETVPIRVSLNAKGHPFSAEVPDRETGRLKLDARYLSRVERSFEIDEIDATEFERRCEMVWARS